MINTTLLEVLVLCFKLISGRCDVDMFTVDMITDGAVQFTYECKIEMFYTEYEQERIIVHATQNDEYELMYNIEDADVASYLIVYPDSTQIMIDLVPYFEALDWESFGIATQQINDTAGNPLIISVENDKVYFISEALNLTLKFDKSLLGFQKKRGV